ncbi:MAG: hypothetical protein IH975_05990 [Nitrospinae bacterium]|nr:hypothetical protein [Nitrospinota bacterium]
MNTIFLFQALEFGVILLFVWVLWFECYQKYRVNSFRQTLFELREELFEYAAEGHIAFDNRAYLEMRYIINGLIRFAHRITSFRVVIYLVSQKVSPHPQYGNATKNWNAALDSIESPEAKERIQLFHKRLLFFVSKHLVATSPTAWLAIMLFACYYGIMGIAKSFGAIREHFARAIKEQAVDSENLHMQFSNEAKEHSTSQALLT